MKTYFKSIFKSMGKNVTKLISVIFIILLGIAFVAGLGTVSPTIKDSFRQELQRNNVSDIIVKSLNKTGFSDNEIKYFSNFDGVRSVDKLSILDLSSIQSNLKIDERRTRIYMLDDFNLKSSKLKCIKGRFPNPTSSDMEICVQRPSNVIKENHVGDVIKVFGMDLKVVGVIDNSLIFDRLGEIESGMTEEETKKFNSGNFSDEDIENLQKENLKKIKGAKVEDVNMTELIIYINRDTIASAISDSILSAEQKKKFLRYSDLYIKLDGESKYFTKSYINDVNDVIANMKSEKNTIKYTPVEIEAGRKPLFMFMTLEGTKSYKVIDEYTDKVSIITLIFPVFFVLVTALVVLTTMTRMVEEERSEIACLASLGFSDNMIVGKYLFIGIMCTLIAAVIGLSAGIFILIAVMYPTFETSFYLPPRSSLLDPTAGLVAFALLLATNLLVTFIVSRKELKVQPAALLQPKAPKAGKAIFIEKTKLWKKISFSRKSTIRNLLRYKKNLFMTIVSVAGSTALVFAGFGFLNIAQKWTAGEHPGMGQTLTPIAIVLIAFALLLCMFVVYNLTNMNIGERKRELATLKVLGYHDGEVVTYIYREIFIMALIGIIVGIPLGCGFMQFLLTFVDLGSLVDVRWYSYVLSGVLVLFFVGVVDLMLIPRILKIDMITSLKSVE